MHFFRVFRRKNAFFVGVNLKKSIIMPVKRVPGGYQWGQTGKVYPTKAQAEAQGRAIYASGYREKQTTPKKK